MKRIFLFLMTNLAVLALLGLILFVVEQVLGVSLGGGGIGNLLVFSAAFGFGGALISLALSKWIAKRTMGARVIAQPQSELEAPLPRNMRSRRSAHEPCALFKPTHHCVFPGRRNDP
jgi:heat shock protein HtpX